MSEFVKKRVVIPVDSVAPEGELNVAAGACGMVLFAHGSGSGRHSPRNQFVAEVIREKGVGTLLFDQLTAEKESVDVYSRHLRFDISLLAERLVSAIVSGFLFLRGKRRKARGEFNVPAHP